MDTQEQDVATFRLGGFDSHGTTRARYRGRWIEVEHGIPGETVLARAVGGRRLRGRILEVLESAPDRVEPPCVYFREWSCGGCQWQQISYQGQVERKREVVETAMREADLPLSVTAVHTLADPWRYRSTAGISLGRRAGFRRHGSLAIVPIRDCPISHPLIGRLMAALNERLEAGALPDFRGRVRLEVRVAGPPEAERLQVLIRPTEEGSRPNYAHLETLTDTLLALEEVGAVSVQQSDGSIRSVHGELFAPTEVAGRPVMLSATSFFQTNLRLLPQLIGRLQEEVTGVPRGDAAAVARERPLPERPLRSEPTSNKLRVADVYGGVGIFGLFLAGSADEVAIVESDPLAVEAGRLTVEQWNLTNVRFAQAPAENALPGERYDVVVVDPPRSGLAPPVATALVEMQPQLLLYISCLAQSLARDLHVFLAAGYHVEHLELFDFYPQTYHVELLAVLRLGQQT
jgi:23S rRNA (uracil1939-C5)-methyltransferase